MALDVAFKLEANLDQVLSLVHQREGIDFHTYRSSTITRRVISRFQKVGCRDCEEYLHLLATDPKESRYLLEHATIKVSRFFRNAEVFDRLRQEVLPELIDRCDPRQGLQLWSAGCANGEEVYSLAMLLVEIERQGLALPPTTIYGTDVDRSALAKATLGIYSRDAFGETPIELIQRNFIERPGRFGIEYEVQPALKGIVSFLHHDLLSAAIFKEGIKPRLILCRNTLIYLQRAAQERVFQLISACLPPGGYLCLGESEQLSREQLLSFQTIDRRLRLYRKR